MSDKLKLIARDLFLNDYDYDEILEIVTEASKA